MKFPIFGIFLIPMTLPSVYLYGFSYPAAALGFTTGIYIMALLEYMTNETH
jgi:hypothetical protein